MRRNPLLNATRYNSIRKMLVGAGLTLCLGMHGAAAANAAENNGDPHVKSTSIFMLSDQGSWAPLLELDPSTGTVQTHRLPGTGNLPSGLGHIGWRSADERLYTAHGEFLVKVNPGENPEQTPIESWTPYQVSGLPKHNKWTYGSISADGNSYIVGNDDGLTCRIDLSSTASPPKFTAKPLGKIELKPWADWAIHPNDGRMYTVDNSNGDLVIIDPNRTPTNDVLKSAAFPAGDTPPVMPNPSSYPTFNIKTVPI